MVRSAYLREAGEQLRQARDHMAKMPRPQTPEQHAEAAWMRMWLAAQFTQVAAVEAGLVPPPLPASARNGSTQ